MIPLQPNRSAESTDLRMARREADTLLKLEGDSLRDKLGIEFRLVDLEDVDEDLARGALLNVCLKLVDLGTFATDDDARARGADDEAELVTGSLDFYRADTSGLQLLAKLSLQLDVFDQQLVVAAFDKPA